MLLSDVLTRLQDEPTAEQALTALGDLVLVAEIDAARAPHEETLGEYVANASRRFAASAGDEDWLQLMGQLERAEAPAEACLRGMLRWALDRDSHPEEAATACTCGGSGGCHAAG